MWRRSRAETLQLRWLLWVVKGQTRVQSRCRTHAGKQHTGGTCKSLESLPDVGFLKGNECAQGSSRTNSVGSCLFFAVVKNTVAQLTDGDQCHLCWFVGLFREAREERWLGTGEGVGWCMCVVMVMWEERWFSSGFTIRALENIKPASCSLFGLWRQLGFNVRTPLSFPRLGRLSQSDDRQSPLAFHLHRGHPFHSRAAQCSERDHESQPLRTEWHHSPYGRA